MLLIFRMLTDMSRELIECVSAMSDKELATHFNIGLFREIRRLESAGKRPSGLLIKGWHDWFNEQENVAYREWRNRGGR